MQKALLLFVFVSASIFAAAQTGSITGVVTDEKTKEAIIGASVLVQGTSIGAAADLDGKFTLKNVPVGTHNLVISFITYTTKTLEGVVVTAGQSTELKVELAEEEANQLEEVVVSTTRSRDTDISVVRAIQESKLVVSGISAEQIRLVPDRDAAQIMQRVPGVSIVDNRFVMIRGVNDRYNQVMINRAIGPATEVDKRAFSFDLIPSGAIDQILIYKSGSPEMPGDFAGGIIQVITKQAPDENYFKIGTSFGFRANTTFKDFSRSERSSTDVLGFDNGFRGLPANFPSTQELQNSDRTSTLREQAGKSLTNNFDYSTNDAPLDFGVNMELSRYFNIKNLKINTLNNITYSNTNQFKEVTFNRYLFDGNAVETRFAYGDKYYDNNVRISAVSNWAFTFNSKHKLEFKNLANLIGEDRTVIREGKDLFLNEDRLYKNYAYNYLNRLIYTGQLQGTHKFAGNSLIVDWVTGFNYINRDEPDFRRFRTFKLISSGEEGYQMQLPPSANLFETGRFYSELTDKGFSNGINVEKKFGNVEEKRTPTLRAGYYFESKTRNFNARYVSYLYPGFFDAEVGEALIRLPLSDIFSPDNIRTQDGFVIEEGTRPSDRYSGENLLVSGYVGGSLPLGKFDISGGFRVEYNRQQISTKTSNGPVKVDNPVVSPMPFINAAYNISDLSLIRLAYSRTINRPEFRELAPFLYYNFELEMGVFGNPDLKTADINNVDLRWEIYPSPGELISAGAFYKHFTNPIETVLQLTAESPQATFGNADKADVYGVEIEVRKSLAGISDTRFFRNLTVNLNASYIISEVDLGNQAGFQQQKRELQGQSPYLFNTGLFYIDDEAGMTASVAYNIFGQRIFQVGDVNFPSIYELSRNSLDVQLSKRFGRLETRLNIQNLLNAEYRFYQDTDVNNKIDVDSQDAPIMRYKTGQQFSLALSYKIGG